MQRILFGDNQFFGVNHLSEEKARSTTVRFQSIDAIMSVLDAARDSGIDVFMCTTHDRVRDVIDRVKSESSNYSSLVFYPSMPYAHKYANAVTEHGMLGALAHLLPRGSRWSVLSSSGMAILRKDIEGVFRALIDVEMTMFSGVRTPVIFLQNVVTDLLLGLGMSELLGVFLDHVSSKYKAEAGFITMNLPLAIRSLQDQHISNPIICTSFNKIGFRMAPDRASYEEIIGSSSARVVAMQVLAAGALRPSEALEYVCRFPQIESILFGASSQNHIVDFVRNVESWDKICGK